MARCVKCGQRMVLGGRRFLRRVTRVEALVSELERAEREARKEIPDTPPAVRSALLEVRSLLGRLIVDGGGLAADLHEAAHHRVLLVDAARVRDWESTAERVLFELLAALDSSAATDKGLEDD